MEEIISSLTEISVEKINIKATTTDYLGYIGREEGIAAIAIAAVKSQSNEII
jgi:2-C-methyl-D-erythritol 2,4-cyclodiphosphate synthase